jgi:hypothetical protein
MVVNISLDLAYNSFHHLNQAYKQAIGLFQQPSVIPQANKQTVKHIVRKAMHHSNNRNLKLSSPFDGCKNGGLHIFTSLLTFPQTIKSFLQGRVNPKAL